MTGEKEKVERAPKRRLTDEPIQLVSLRVRLTEKEVLYQKSSESFYTINGYVVARLQSVLREPLTHRRITAIRAYRDHLNDEPLVSHGLRIPRSLHDRLEVQVKKVGCSKNTFIRHALFGHLKLKSIEIPPRPDPQTKNQERLTSNSGVGEGKGKASESTRRPKRRTFMPEDENLMGKLSVRFIREHEVLLDRIAASRFRSKNAALLSIVGWFLNELDKGCLSLKKLTWEPAYDEAQSYKRLALQFRAEIGVIERIRELIKVGGFPSVNHFFCGLLMSYMAEHPEQGKIRGS